MTNTKTEELANNQVKDFDLAKIIEDLFLVLTTKERDVIVKRFSISSDPKMTLEKIGKHFSVTRERVRQIEKIALNKLRRTVSNSRLKLINDLSKAILRKNGGVMLESRLVNEILTNVGTKNSVDSSIIRLALNIEGDLSKISKTKEFKPFWRFKDIDLNKIRAIMNASYEVLKKNKDVMSGEKIGREVIDNLKDDFDDLSVEIVSSCLEIDHRIKDLNGFYGLMSWRHINPKSIRDKAYIVLKGKKEPLHFIDIANNISSSGFDRKVVTTQAVHNELIRCDLFVLVGRGLYALKEWGYKSGTVAEIIRDLLRKKSPMTKQEIIQGVLKQRRVKKGTISLNLQKVPCFARVGRAVYSLDESKGLK